MVKIAKNDPITEQLASASCHDEIRNWLDFCLMRDVLRKKAATCALMGWVSVTVLTMLCTLMLGYFQISTSKMLRFLASFHDPQGNNDATIPFRPWEASLVEPLTDPQGASLTALLQPWLPLICLISLCIACFLLPLAWKQNLIPGFRSLRNSINYMTLGQAMSQMIGLGLPYPRAFRASAETLPKSPLQGWIYRAADSVEAGQSLLPATMPCRAEDTALLNLIQRTDSETQNEWLLIANHYEAAAKRQLSLLAGAVPVAATLISGLILWLSVSFSLGSFWGSLFKQISDFGW